MKRFRNIALWMTLVLTFAVGMASPSSAQTPEIADRVEQALSTNAHVYVSPKITVKVNGQPTDVTIDQGALMRAAVQGKGLNEVHTYVDIAVLNHLPPGEHSRNRYGQRLHDDLNLGNNGLVLVAFNGEDRGVTVIAPQLGRSKSTQIADEGRANIVKTLPEPTVAISRMAEQVAVETNTKEYGGSVVLWMVFLIVVVVIVALVASASRRKKRELATIREPLNQLRTSVLSGIEYLDNYMDVLPKNNPDSDQVRIFRQSASQKYDQAVKVMDRATELSDLNRAQGLFDRAQADVDQARRYLDRATGGTGSIPGDDAMRPQPLPASEAEVNAIPQNQRGVSFFSGQPAPLGALVPVTVTINGQSKQVLVTPEEADELRQGRMPQVRAFQQGNQWVPWYEYQSYDPYRDYWRYQNNGWGGFGSGVLAGVVGAELLGDLFRPNYGYNTPWAFSTDNGYYQGYADAQQRDFGGWDGGGYANAGNFGGWDNSPQIQDGGGSDFTNADFNSADNSPSDWSGDSGGWQDSGGSDSGGSDFGGSDFGGSDFGGGDSGGGGGDW